MPGPFADPWDDVTPDAAALIANGQVNIRALKRALEQRLADALNNWPDGDLSPKIRNLQVVAAMIANKTITAAQIADATITSLQIADGGIATADLADLLITTAKLDDRSVTSAKIALLAITTALVADGLDGAKLADGSVNGTKLTDGSVPLSKLSGGGAVDTAELVDGAVTEAKLGDLAVTMAKLAVSLKDKMAVAKYVDLAIPLTTLGANSTHTIADTAFPGVSINDAVTIGLPDEYRTLTDASVRKLLGITGTGKADAVSVAILNNNDGPLDWPASTVRLWVVKSATLWGGSL